MESTRVAGVESLEVVSGQDDIYRKALDEGAGELFIVLASMYRDPFGNLLTSATARCHRQKLQSPRLC